MLSDTTLQALREGSEARVRLAPRPGRRRCASAPGSRPTPRPATRAPASRSTLVPVRRAPGELRRDQLRPAAAALRSSGSASACSSARCSPRRPAGARRPLLHVRSGSMSPAIETGDVVVTEPLSPLSARVGDIVTFRDPEGGGKLFSHRVQAVTAGRRRRSPSSPAATPTPRPSAGTSPADGSRQGRLPRAEARLRARLDRQPSRPGSR